MIQILKTTAIAVTMTFVLCSQAHALEELVWADLNLKVIHCITEADLSNASVDVVVHRVDGPYSYPTAYTDSEGRVDIDVEVRPDDMVEYTIVPSGGGTPNTNTVRYNPNPCQTCSEWDVSFKGTMSVCKDWYWEEDVNIILSKWNPLS